MPGTQNITQTDVIDAGIDAYYDRLFLERALPELPHMQWGQKRPIPQGNSATIKFRRYGSLTPATTPLNEVIDPEPETLGKTDILATTSIYGKVVKVSEQLNLTVPDNITAETTELLSENYAETMDELTRDSICATASTTTCSNGSPTATLLNRTDIDTVVQTLIGNRAKWTAGMISASKGVGTTPISKAFMGILDTDLLDDIGDVSGFVDTANYPSNGAVADNEWGKTGHVRWQYTDKGYTSGSNYYCPVFGKNSYGMVNIEGGGSKLIHHPKESAGSDLELYETFGWKERYVARILNSLFMHVLICTNG